MELPFGAWLKGELQARNLKPVDLHRLIGVSAPTVSRWLNSGIIPESDNCAKIAQVLDIPLDVVLARAGHRDDPGAIQSYNAQQLLREIESRVADLLPGDGFTAVRLIDPSEPTALGGTVPIQTAQLEGVTSPIAFLVRDEALSDWDLLPGDIALIDGDVDPAPGEIALVRVDAHDTLMVWDEELRSRTGLRLKGKVVRYLAAREPHNPSLQRI